MKLEQLKEIKSKIFDIVSNNLEGTKNKEYANKQDVFKNFNKAAEFRNKNNAYIAFDYLTKHLISVDDILDKLKNDINFGDLLDKYKDAVKAINNMIEHTLYANDSIDDGTDFSYVPPTPIEQIVEKFTDSIGYLILIYGMIYEKYGKNGLLKEEQEPEIYHSVTREDGEVIYGFADTDFDDIETEPEPTNNVDLSYILERAKANNATINGFTTDEFEVLMNGGKIDVSYRFEDEPVKAPYGSIRPTVNVQGCI